MARLTLNKYVGDPALNGFRLTLTSGTPVTTADVTGATTLYYTPYKGDNIVLWDGTNWQLYQSAEVSLALGTLANASNYDVWVRDVNGTLTLDLSAAWTNDTTRSEAIATTNGVTHKSGDQTRRLVSTIRTTSTTTCEDSLAKRFVSNLSHPTERPMLVKEATDSWTYTTATFRAANGSTANALAFVLCEPRVVAAAVHTRAGNTTAAAGTVAIVVGIGVDSTTVSSADYMGGIHAGVITNPIYRIVTAKLRAHSAIGAHTWTWLEYSTASGTTTWTGDGGAPTTEQSGISGTVWN